MRNYSNYKPSKGEVFIKPSLTVPDQSLPLKTLLERYVRGGDVVQFPAVYTGEDDNIELDKLSTIERVELLNEIRNGIAQTRMRLQEEQKQKSPVQSTDEPLAGSAVPSVNEGAEQTKQ